MLRRQLNALLTVADSDHNDVRNSMLLTMLVLKKMIILFHWQLDPSADFFFEKINLAKQKMWLVSG